jgi:acetolactate synthase small subunit
VDTDVWGIAHIMSLFEVSVVDVTTNKTVVESSLFVDTDVWGIAHIMSLFEVSVVDVTTNKTQKQVLNTICHVANSKLFFVS